MDKKKDDNFFRTPQNNDELTLEVKKDIQKSGLTPETLEKARVELFSGSEDDLKKKLGRVYLNGQLILNAARLIEFPYYDRDGNEVLCRYKLIPPIIDSNGEEVKYLHPIGKPAIPYILLEVWKVKGKANKPIIITEGEKKVLKLIQHGRPSIGLSGIWNFKAGKESEEEDSKDLWKELKSFSWKGRTAYLAFDSDLWDNPYVRHAIFELGLKLIERKALVKVMIWNNREGKGIDDYLARKKDPEKELQHLEDKAKDLLNSVRPEFLYPVVRALARIEIEDYGLKEQVYRELSQRLKLKKDILMTSVKIEWRKLHPEREGFIFTEEEKKQALELLKNPNLIDEFLNTCHSRYVGRDKELLLVKLATETRHFNEGLGVVLTGTVSVGKSELIKTVSLTVNPEEIEDFTRTSENYLLYRTLPLEHRVITCYEMRGIQSTAHILRTAISEDNLSLGTVLKDSLKGLSSREIKKSTKGMVFLSTTTKGSIEPEIETRVIKIEISHDERIAREVYTMKANDNHNYTCVPFKIWQVVDKILEPKEVVIPYAGKLAELFPTSEERYHRDFCKILLLIKASALLHQFQREKDEQGRVVASKEDYELIYNLSSLFTQSASPVSSQIVKFLTTVKELNKKGSQPHREEVMKALKVSEATIKRYVREAYEKEFINVKGKGKKSKIKLLDIPETVSILPLPNEVFVNDTYLPPPPLYPDEPMSQIPQTQYSKGKEIAQSLLSRNEPMSQNDEEDKEDKNSSIAQNGSIGSELMQSQYSKGFNANSSIAHSGNIGRLPIAENRKNTNIKFDEVAEIGLSKFEEVGLVVKIHSKLLGEDIYFISDESLREKIKDNLVIYSSKELKELAKFPSSLWRKVHLLKKELGLVFIE